MSKRRVQKKIQKRYRVGNRIRIHGSDGRILKWINAPKAKVGKGDKDMTEWLIYYDYKQGVPSGWRNFEMRMVAPTDWDESDVIDKANDVMSDLTNSGFSDSAFSHASKVGKDDVKGDGEWKANVTDVARPQFSYPNKRHGDSDVWGGENHDWKKYKEAQERRKRDD